MNNADRIAMWKTKNTKADTKIVIDALREEERSKKELMRILQERRPTYRSDPIRKKVEGYLEKLKFWGLVYEPKIKGQKRYCWYIYPNIDSNEDSFFKLDHSRELIPALEAILESHFGLEPLKKETLTSREHWRLRAKIDYAEKHLVTYKRLCELRENEREQRKKLDEEADQFIANLEEKIQSEFGMKAVALEVGFRMKKFMGTNIPLLILQYITRESSKFPMIEIKENEEIYLEYHLVAKGKNLLKKVEKFIDRELKDENNIETAWRIDRIEKKHNEITSELREEIYDLILSIESGKALTGKCNICRKGTIKEKKISSPI